MTDAREIDPGPWRGPSVDGFPTKSDELLYEVILRRMDEAEAALDQAREENRRLRDALEAAWRGVDSLARYNHQPEHPFPYGAILNIAGLLRHALDTAVLASPDGQTDERNET